MKALAVALLAAALSGCLNVATRLPVSERRVCETWQCSSEMADVAYSVMFPQMVDGMAGGRHLSIENLFTIPIGCIYLADAAAEAAVDAACWPADKLWLSKRED